MKVLVLYHTAWMEAMMKCWQKEEGVEVAGLPLPVVDWDQQPGLKDRIAKLIVEYAAVWRPDIILDVNGAGCLPVSGERRWTPELALTPWVEWWYNDPMNYAKRHAEAGTLELWLKALGCPVVKNIIWDATLAKEYSEWTGKEWTHLTAATDVGLFSPESAKESPLKFPSTDLCFLGSWYPLPSNVCEGELGDEINHVVANRVMYPNLSFFDLIEKEPERLPCFAGIVSRAKRKRWGAYTPEIISLKEMCNAKAGYFLRSNPFEEIAKAFPSRLIAGDNWAKKYKPMKEKIYIPSCLSACYRASTVCLDLPNLESYSGTNMRVYEILAAGGILATSRRPDFDPEGKLDGKVYFHFEKTEQLKKIVESLKITPSLVKKVSENAIAYVRSKHSWSHRLKSILKAAEQVV